jgi:hypothetical protein
LSVYHFIFVVLFYDGVVWGVCIRTRIPHFGEDAEYPFIFLDVSGYCLVNYCMCVNTNAIARGSGGECVVFDSNVFEMK